MDYEENIKKFIHSNIIINNFDELNKLFTKTFQNYVDIFSIENKKED